MSIRAVVTLALLLISVQGQAGLYLVEQTAFVRSKGKPAPDSVSFTARYPAGEFILKVENGPEGYCRISAADVWLNGESVVKPSDLNQNVGSLEREVSLQPHNVLKGLLRSKPGCALGLELWGIDDNDPTVAIVHPPRNLITNNNRPAIEVAYDDAESGIDPATLRILVNGENRTELFDTDTAGAVWTPPTGMELPEGENTVVAKVRDRAGNTARDTIVFTVDVTPPVIAISVPVEARFYQSDSLPPLAYDVTDNLDRNPSASVSGWGTNEGPHTVTVTATDAAGNVSSASVSYIVDDTPPVIAINAPAEGAYYQGVDVPDAAYEVTDNLDPYPWFGQTGWSRAEREQTMTVTARDAAGNTAEASVSYIVDDTPPEVEIVSPEDGSSTRETPVDVLWTVDGVTQTAQTTEELMEGDNRIVRSAVDLAGNVGADTVLITLKVGCVEIFDTTMTIGPTDLGYEHKSLCIVNSHLTILGYHVFDSVGMDNSTVVCDTGMGFLILTESNSSTVTHLDATTDAEYGLRLSGERIVVDAGSLIDVTGRGYVGDRYVDGRWRGGRTRGNRKAGNSSRSLLHVCAGSYGGLGGHLLAEPVPTYGSADYPRDLGTGGGARRSGSTGYYGGDAGGRVWIECRSMVLSGTVVANGNPANGGTCGGGSGGSVYIAADSVLGNGLLQAAGGSGYYKGGGGRIALHCCFISPSILDNIRVGGHQVGTLSTPCHTDVAVEILSPEDSSYHNHTPVPVHWVVNGRTRQEESIEHLVEGENLIVRAVTVEGKTARDTVVAFLDTVAPTVVILWPPDGHLTNKVTIPVEWTVDGVVQSAGATQTVSEGTNTIVRTVRDSAGNVGSDTATVTLDTQPPVVEFVNLRPYGIVLYDTIVVEWLADGVPQTTGMTHIMHEGANRVTRSAMDAANNVDSAVVYVYRGAVVPLVEGMPVPMADSLLRHVELDVDTTWVDDFSSPTGSVIAQEPSAGDTAQLGMPVELTIAVGPDGVDLVPVGVDAEGVTVDPSNLKPSGTVLVRVACGGAKGITDPYNIVVYEDRDANGVLDAATDNILGGQSVTDGHGAGETLEISVPIRVSNSLLFRDNRLFVLVDCDNDVSEINEHNNGAHSMIECRRPDREVVFDPVLEWRWTRSSGAGPFDLAANPVVAQLSDDNQDGVIDTTDIPDIAFVSSNWRSNRGTLWAVSGADGSTHWSAGGDLFAWVDPAVGDLDGDGDVEIVADACEHGRRLAVYDHTGQELWRGQPGDPEYSFWWGGKGIALADLDHDGKTEIAWGPHVFDHDGTLRWPDPLGSGLGLDLTEVHIADLNLDSKPEIVNFNGHVRVFSSTGDSVRQWPNQGHWAVGPAIPANLDSDPYPELVQAYREGISVWEHTGALKWATSDEHILDAAGYPLIGDFDGDGEHEIVHGGQTYGGEEFLKMVECDGTVRWRSVLRKMPSSVVGNGQPTAFDFNGDGRLEVVYLRDRRLWVVDGGTGETVGTLMFSESERICLQTGVLIADIDNDNQAEIVVPQCHGSGGLRVYGSASGAWPNTRRIWNQYSYHGTNINEDGSIPRYEPNSWQEHDGYKMNPVVDALACVDITCSRIRFDRARGGDTLGIVARIGNAGVAKIGAPTKVSFYDGDPQADGALLHTTNLGRAVYPGECVDLAWLMESGMRGLHTIHVVADDDGAGNGVLIESDENNNEAAASLSYANAYPSVTPVPNGFAEVGVLYTFAVEAVDPDGDTLSFRLKLSPPGMSIDSHSGEIRWVPAGPEPIANPVVLEVGDGYGGNVTADFTVYVGVGENRPPSIISFPPDTAVANPIVAPPPYSVYRYQVVAVDPDNDELQYSLDMNDPMSPGGMTIDTAMGLVTWVPFTPLAGGTYTARIVVADGKGGIASQDLSISVLEGVNVPPVFAGEPDTVTTQGERYAYAPSAFDLDNDPVWMWLAAGPDGMSFATPDTIVFIPGNEHVGTHVVRIGVRDAEDTTYQQFLLHVVNVNDAPVVTSVPETTVVENGEYVYEATARDPDGDSVAFLLVDGPAGFTVSSGGLARWTGVGNAPGLVSLTLHAADPHGAYVEQSWSIRIDADTLAPRVAILPDPVTAYPGEGVTVTVSATDNAGVASRSLAVDGVPVTLDEDGRYLLPTTAPDTILLEAQATDVNGLAGRSSREVVVTYRPTTCRLRWKSRTPRPRRGWAMWLSYP